MAAIWSIAFTTILDAAFKIIANLDLTVQFRGGYATINLIIVLRQGTDTQRDNFLKPSYGETGTKLAAVPAMRY